MSARQQTHPLTRPAPVRIIEQDTAVRDSIAQLLELCELTVRGYARGYDFIADFHRYPTRCVLCAAELPDTRGLDLYQLVISSQPKMPFALLASRRIADTSAAARMAGIEQILNKPMVDPASLLAFVGIQR